jgi:hypothetical protein
VTATKRVIVLDLDDEKAEDEEGYCQRLADSYDANLIETWRRPTDYYAARKRLALRRAA